MRKILFLLATMLLVPVTDASAAEADAPDSAGVAAAAVAPFVDGQTILVARLDAAAVDFGAVEAWVKQAAGPAGAESVRLDALHAGIGRLTTAQADFQKAGGRAIYIVVSFGDTPGGLAFVVAPLEHGADAKAIEKVLNTWSPDPATHAATIGKSVVLPFGDALARLEHFKPTPRPELAKAFAEGGDAPLVAAIIPSEQVRRVVEAISPRLPPDTGGGPVTVLTRGLMSGSVAVRLPPQPGVRVVIDSQDADAANAFAGLIRLGLLAARNQPPRETANLFGLLVSPLSPKVEGDRVVLALDDKALAAQVRQLHGPALQATRISARVRSANNIRQLLLACIIYANDHKGEFPDTLEMAIQGAEAPPGVLVNPVEPSRRPGYVYVEPPSLKDLNNASGRLVVYEAFDKWDAGVNVGFADGHAEFVRDEAVFVKLLNDAGAAHDKK
jgi:prepilin-type processing-associated H-X9-DG protein